MRLGVHRLLIVAYIVLGFFALRTLYTFFPAGPVLSLSPSAPPSKQDTIWPARAAAVKAAFRHAYHGYQVYAAPRDELRPVSMASNDNFNGWGVTIVDSLDTMLLLGMEEEFNATIPFIEQLQFGLPSHKIAPYFETVIRYLGGLLSAHALSQNPVFLSKADELAGKLSGVFNTPSKLATFGINPTTGTVQGQDTKAAIAEFATLQVEYLYLAKHTGKKEHFDRVENLMQTLLSVDLNATGGMLPTDWNIQTETGHPVNTHISTGGRADSAHEYLLKHYLLTSKTDKRSLDLYIRATTTILTQLLFLSPMRGFLYVSDRYAGQPARGAFEHLSCFLPGLLALGAHTLPLDDLATPETRKAFPGLGLKEVHLLAAKGLGQSCWLTYAESPIGLGSEAVQVVPAPGDADLWTVAMRSWITGGSRGSPPGVRHVTPNTSHGKEYFNLMGAYYLRPETIESLYILWKTTGEPQWRQRAWSIFLAIEKHCKTLAGYASIMSVDMIQPVQLDSMPSYFMAETLKYLYLTFIDEDPVPLDQWVFNTEAHPLPIFKWTQEERLHFGI